MSLPEIHSRVGRKRVKCAVCGQGHLLTLEEIGSTPAQFALAPEGARRMYPKGTFLCAKHQPLRMVKSVGNLGLWVRTGSMELGGQPLQPQPVAKRGVVYVIDPSSGVLHESFWAPKGASFRTALELAETWAIRVAQKPRKTSRLHLREVKQLASAWLQICASQGVKASTATDTRTKSFRKVRDLFLTTTAWFQSLPEDQLRMGLRRIAAWAAKLPSLPYQPPLLLPPDSNQERPATSR